MNALYTRATVGVALAAAFIGSLFLPPQQPLPPAQIEKTTVVTTANTEVLDELPSKSQQDGQQHPSGINQDSNKGPAYGGDTSGTQGKGKGEGSSRPGQDQREQNQQNQQSSRQNDRDNSGSKDEESRRMSDEDVEKLIEQVVESERERWDRKLSEANGQAKEWEQKYNQAKQDLTKNLAPKPATVAEDEFTEGPVQAFWNDPSNLFWVGLETMLFLGTLLWASMRSTKEKVLLRQMEEKLRTHKDIETQAVGTLEVIKGLFGRLEDRFPSADDKLAMHEVRGQVDDIVTNLNAAIRAETDEIVVETGVIADVKPTFDDEGVVMNEAGLDASSPVVIQQTPSKKKKKHHK